MSSAYVYRKRVRRSRYSEFRRRVLLIMLILVPFAAVGSYIYLGLNSAKSSQPISAVQNTEINGNKKTFTNDYFQFEDSGTWVVDKNSSDSQKIVYHRFNKNVQQAEMIVYINFVPIPLNLNTPRALPVRIINDNSFQATAVSNPCVTTYAKNELHNVKEVSINGATMLCDPDSPQYYIQLTEIGGDYRLKMKRSSGKPIQFVITYKDTGFGSRPDSLLNVTSSFKPR